MVIVLHHTAHLDRSDSKFIQYLQADIHLPPASVHTDEIRKIRKGSKLVILTCSPVFLHLIESVFKTAGKHLIHGSIIIRALYRFDTELSVVIVLGFTVLIYHHGPHIQCTHGVGNIIGFDAKRRLRKPHDLLKFLNSPGALCILFTVLLPVTVHQYSGICHGKFHKLFLLAYLRGDDAYLFPLLAAKPLLKNILVRQFRLNPKLMRNERSSIVILFNKIIQDLLISLLLINVYKLMIPSYDLSVPDKKYLHNAVGKLSPHSDDIPVSGIVGHYLLPVLNGFDGFYQISHFYSCFKVKII